MTVIYRFQGVEFEWDANKAQGNIENHGVTFEEAAEVFFDPFFVAGMPLLITNNVISLSDTHLRCAFC